MKTLITKKSIIITATAIVVISLAIIFLPQVYSQSSAEGKYSDVVKSKTIQEKQSFWNNLWSPKYILFNNEDNTAEAHWVKLSRKNIFFWKIKEIGKQSYTPSENINQASAKDNLNSLYDAVKSGKLTANSKDLNISDNSTKDDPIANEPIIKTDDLTLSGALRSEISDTYGKNKAQLITGPTPNENQIILNGKKIESLKNVTSVNFDLEGKYLYYSKYTLKQDEFESYPVSSGKIFRMDAQTRKEELIYDFKDNVLISFRANQEKIAYSLNTNEVGVIDLKTKAKKIVPSNQIPKTEEAATETQSNLLQCIDIDTQTAMFKVISLDPAGKDQFFKVDLEKVSVNK